MRGFFPSLDEKVLFGPISSLVHLILWGQDPQGKEGKSCGIRENKRPTHLGMGLNSCSEDWELWKHRGNCPGAAEGLGQGHEWLWPCGEGHRMGWNSSASPRRFCTGRAQGMLVAMTKSQRCQNPPWPSSESPHFHLLKQRFYYKEMLKVKMDGIHFTSPIDFPGYLQLQRY